MTDAELMERVKFGDEDAFRQIVEKHKTIIFSLCMQYVGNREDAEEVAQDVFIKLYKKADIYEPRAKLSTFLYRIAVNLSLNKIRDRKRKKLISLDLFTNKDKGAFANSEIRPDQILERKERAAIVRRAIDKLPKNQRTAVLLKRFQGLSYDEIADVMQCSVSAVESRLFRAKQNLQKELEEFRLKTARKSD